MEELTEEEVLQRLRDRKKLTSILSQSNLGES